MSSYHKPQGLLLGPVDTYKFPKLQEQTEEASVLNTFGVMKPF